MSIIGPVKLAIEIKKEIYNFLKLELGTQLNGEKTLIINAHNKNAEFLKTSILSHVNPDRSKKRTMPCINLRAPINKLISELREQKFIKWKKDGKTACSVGVTRLINLDHKDIVNYYNNVLYNILNYYTFRDNYSSLWSVVNLLRTSCARTLARKYKLGSAAKAYKKFGKLLTCPKSGTKIYKPDSLCRIRCFNTNIL